ncbi:hypothetical protein FEE95_06720 [Maribacter algarum]|uniref:Uncharacterized protein n=1 Tax=Maribacter algarum (ex Zhang et al. 2020) TaxID=2578118 RepID=A0A5S3PW23_9FLAO|nr:hypothetical protein [Maribacter algarum]TMM59120.1 hypothetical protein FEE95_06720 [Maribacter algarum]
MKKIYYKITSVLLALIVLLSTMSFSLDMHFCGDQLVDFSISDKANTCLMKTEMTKTSSSCEVMKMEMGCCSDVEVVFEGRDDLKISFDQLTFNQQVFVASSVYSYISRFEGFDENLVPLKDYKPPPLIRDLQILDQTFLI